MRDAPVAHAARLAQAAGALGLVKRPPPLDSRSDNEETAMDQETDDQEGEGENESAEDRQDEDESGTRWKLKTTKRASKPN